MSRDDDFETELTGSREEIAGVLSGVADGLLAGSVRLGEGADAVAVDVPDDLTLEIEFETDDGVSLELEMEWPSPDGGPVTAPVEDLVEGGGDDGGDGERVEDDDTESPLEDDVPIPVGAADASQSLARFEVFHDRAEQWRWRLRHRNGNIIATSGEGYTRKHNAWKGLRSVMQNAPEAEVRED